MSSALMIAAALRSKGEESCPCHRSRHAVPACPLLPKASPKPSRSPWAAAPLVFYFIKHLENNKTSPL